MLSQSVIAVVSIICFTHLIKALPTANLSSPYPESILYSWSTESVCTTTARKSDCTTAFASLCAREDLGVSGNTTVGDCTALYWYDTGNTKPTAAECTAAYTQILTASIGGALGYNASNVRTNDPLYAIYPKDGNANCLKAAGDTSPVMAMNALPGGGTLPTCPVSTSRRRRALELLEGRGQTNGEDDGVIGCVIEDGVWGLGCTAVCLTTVTAASWITGPFVAVGWLACLGGCTATGAKVFNNCQQANGNTDPDSLVPFPIREREEAEEPTNPCVTIKQWSFSCPGQETGLLNAHNCQETINT